MDYKWPESYRISDEKRKKKKVLRLYNLDQNIYVYILYLYTYYGYVYINTYNYIHIEERIRSFPGGFHTHDDRFVELTSLSIQD